MSAAVLTQWYGSAEVAQAVVEGRIGDVERAMEAAERVNAMRASLAASDPDVIDRRIRAARRAARISAAQAQREGQGLRVQACRPGDRAMLASKAGADLVAAVAAALRDDDTDTPQGDQPRFERGREVMEPTVCESAGGRGTNGAPALAALPQHASPDGGPMGAGQPAAAGPTGGRRFKEHLWTDRDPVIRSLWGSETMTEIARRVGVDATSLRVRAEHLGLDMEAARRIGDAVRIQQARERAAKAKAAADRNRERRENYPTQVWARACDGAADVRKTLAAVPASVFDLGRLAC